MELVRRALLDLRRQPKLLAVYVLAHFLLIVALRAGERLVGMGVDPASAPEWYPAFNLAKQFAMAAIVAAVQAIVFARLGKAIDRPLWKCASDQEALQRFFVLWFVVNLIGITTQQFLANAQPTGDQGLMALSTLLYLAAYLLLTPLATCIMYFGRLDWARIPEALAPFGRQLKLAASALLLQLLAFALNDVAAGVLLLVLGKDGLDAAIVAPALAITLPAALECLVFVVVWRVCMTDRDSHLYDDPYEF